MVLRRLLPTALVAVLVLAGACSSDGGDDDASSSTTTGATTTEPSGTTSTDTDGSTTTAAASSTTTTAEEGSPTTTAGQVGDREPKSGPADGAGTAQLVDVRTGRHDGFDRIVLEFADEVQPAWWVEWVDGPITQTGSGNPVEVDGGAYLQIRTEPASGYDLEAGAATFEPDRVPGPGGGPVTEVVRVGDFEANLIWVAGAAERTPFTVSVLGSPSRLVVDVAPG